MLNQFRCTQTLRVPVSTTEQEEVQVQVTRVLVESYFDIVRKNLQDAVPKVRAAPCASLIRNPVPCRQTCAPPQQTAAEPCCVLASRQVIEA